MFIYPVFWLWFAGLIFLSAGFVVIRKDFFAARGLGKLIVLGPMFVGAPLAVFSGEHFTMARALMQIVPAWLPAHLFVTYFVGCALVSAAISLCTLKFVRLSATMLGIMFFGFVLLMDLPGAISEPGNSLGWTLALRESAFAAGAWALAGSQKWGQQARKQNWMILLGRYILAFAAIRFGIENLLHPEFAPGVPDSKLTAAWVPLHAFLGYPVGIFLLVAGSALLLNERPRVAAASIGALMTLLTLCLYVPIMAVTPRDVSQMVEAINFVFDTLLFGGTALLVAGALPED